MVMNGNNRWRARAVAVLCAVFVLGLAAGVSAADLTYIVKRNDTLYGISRRYGVSVAELAERNGLSRSAHIYVGQRLIVPVKSGDASPPSASVPATIQKAITSAPVRAGRWKHIVIHHSGVNSGTLEGMDRYHREERHMENGLAYHFVIGNGHGMRDGEIAVGRRWTGQLDGGHLASQAQNKTSIGICLVGNFDRTKPTSKQLQSLQALTQALMNRCKLPVSAVKTHQEINVIHTRCPGRYFPAKSFVQDLKSGG